MEDLKILNTINEAQSVIVNIEYWLFCKFAKMLFVEHQIGDISISGYAPMSEPSRKDVALTCSGCFRLALMLRATDQDDLSTYTLLFYVS